jgi:hypothetical protein
LPAYIQDAGRNKDQGVFLDRLLRLTLKGPPKDGYVTDKGNFFIDLLNIFSQQTPQK